MLAFTQRCDLVVALHGHETRRIKPRLGIREAAAIGSFDMTAPLQSSLNNSEEEEEGVEERKERRENNQDQTR